MNNKEQKSSNQEIKIGLAVLINDVEYIKNEISQIKKKLDKDYVTRSEFDPVKKIVYGTVATILTMVLVALVYLILK